MCESVPNVVASLQNLLSDLDASAFGQTETKELFEQFVLIERLGAAGKSLMGVQAAETKLWWEGYRSPAHYVADKSKCTVNHAAEMLHTVEHMKDLPRTDRAFRAGSLTELQAKEVVSAAVLDSASQRELLEIAELESLAELRRQASRVRAAAMSEEQKYQRAHKKRELRHWTDIEGTFHLTAGMTPDSGAVVLACLRPFFEELARAAAKSGIKQRATAQMADALVQMAKRSRCIPPDALRPGPTAVVHLRMDYAALVRGYLKPGEICEVPGVGPIGLEAAKVFLADSYRVGILMDGEDIRSVKGLGHSIPDRLRRAVHERDDWRCVVPGCCMECSPKDIDHVIPVAQGGQTKLYNLALLCTWHHYLKTHHGYRLKHYKHRWLFSSPNDPPPEENSNQPELTTVV
ncbi:MAG TPA: HNH endonuclease [Actinomycetota bacterium]|nr:HNH endonuclease [Actinomycetota bacterium]